MITFCPSTSTPIIARISTPVTTSAAGPTTSFLTPHGGYIAGATYLPADQFLAMLDEVRRAYADQKPQLYEQANDILRQRREHAARVSAGREPDATLVDSITRRAAGAYDPRNGGFGVEPKFPSTPMLRLLLHQYRTTGEPFFRSMLEKTLDAIVRGELHDTVDGGFFRFAAFDNWTEPQHEKMAEDNIALAGVLLDAGVALDRPDYRAIAARTIDYVVDHPVRPGRARHPGAAREPIPSTSACRPTAG